MDRSFNNIIIAQAIIAAAQEMGVKLVQSAFSTIIREAQDCSAALMDRRGNVIAQAELIPMHMCGMSRVFAACVAKYPIETLKEGEFLVNNDPYNGGHHLPDVFFFTPIFFEGELIGFSASICHHLDLGGGDPGLNAKASDLHQEGLVIPPSKWNLEEDWNGGRFEQLLASNIRVPHLTIGDCYAQMAANAVGIERIRQLCKKYGVQQTLGAMDYLLDYSEARMRAAISEVPDGVYQGVAFADDDGLNSEPLRIQAAVSVKGDEIAVSFDGTSAQVLRNMNVPFTSTLSAVMACMKAVLTDSDVPFNEGAMRPITVTAPAGSLLNPNYPAPVRARMIVAYRAFNAVMQALSQAMPGRAIADGFDSTTVVCLSRLGEEGYKVYIEVFGGGFGASRVGDGCDAVDSPLSNCSNTPIEALDMEYDYFRVVDYSLAADSFGLGKYRGGAGFHRDYEVLRDDVTLSIYSDRFRSGARGVFGGQGAALGACDVIRAGEVVYRLRAKDDYALRKGDIVRFKLGGGGGYGSLDERAPALIELDISEGLLTSEYLAQARAAAV